MSRVPYLDRLGDEFERAVTESAPRQQRASTVMVTAFVMVLLVGGGLWLLRGGLDPDIAVSSTTTTGAPEDPVSLDAPSIPATWARVPNSTAFGAERRTTVGAVSTTEFGFVAVGTADPQNQTDAPTGVIIESTDGIDWRTVTEIDGVNLNDVTVGGDGVVAVGMRDFRPVIVDGDGSVIDLPILETSGERAIMARGIAATDSGYVIVGDELEATDEQRQRGAIWRSDDGASWMTVDSPALGWYHEASILDLTVDSGTVLAVGLVSSEPGTSIPTVWISTDGLVWEQIDLPTDADGGFTVASGVAFGHGRYVAVGSKPSISGPAGTAWVSEDGHTWEQLTDNALTGVDGAATRIASVVPVADGFVAVGHSLERPTSRHVIWTADASASSWTRLDLADPSRDISTSAFAITANADRVVITGAAFDITYSEASGAVWVGPAPASLEAGVPIATAGATEGSADGDRTVALSIDPTQAVEATSVRVVGRLPANHGLDDVLVQITSGDVTIDLCSAVTQGRNYMCRVTIDYLEPRPQTGTYEVTANGVDPPAEIATIEILPEGTPIIRLTGVYTPTHGPLLQSLSIQNKGGQDIDLAGWSIVNEGRDEPRFDFPAGTMVAAGSSVVLDFSGPMGARCPENTNQYFHWCRVVSDSDRVDYGEDQMLWRGGLIQVVDTNGEFVAEWRPS